MIYVVGLSAKFFYALYRISVKSSELERSFSALRGINSWQRNRISNSAAEIRIKTALLAPTLTEEAIQYIIRDLVSRPGRAKTRNIAIWMMMVKSRNETLMKTNYENI